MVHQDPLHVGAIARCVHVQAAVQVPVPAAGLGRHGVRGGSGGLAPMTVERGVCWTNEVDHLQVPLVTGIHLGRRNTLG